MKKFPALGAALLLWTTLAFAQQAGQQGGSSSAAAVSAQSSSAPAASQGPEPVNKKRDPHHSGRLFWLTRIVEFPGRVVMKVGSVLHLHHKHQK